MITSLKQLLTAQLGRQVSGIQRRREVLRTGLRVERLERRLLLTGGAMVAVDGEDVMQTSDLEGCDPAIVVAASADGTIDGINDATVQIVDLPSDLLAETVRNDAFAQFDAAGSLVDEVETGSDLQDEQVDPQLAVTDDLQAVVYGAEHGLMGVDLEVGTPQQTAPTLHLTAATVLASEARAAASSAARRRPPRFF